MNKLKPVFGLLLVNCLFLCPVQAQNASFVTVANPDYAAYSTNGVNWTFSPLPSLGNWFPVVNGNGVFATIANGTSGNSPNAAYSTNGISWTGTSMPSSNNWSCAAYGNGTFVALTSGTNQTAYSSDGIHWHLGNPLPASANWESVVFGNGLFVAVANDSTNAAYSPDGINWSSSTLPGSVAWQPLAFGNGVFATLGGQNGHAGAAYSTNGINWISTPIFYNNWTGLAFGEGLFVTVGFGSGTFAYSTNGIQWVQGAMPSGGWEGLTFANTVNGSNAVFVATAVNSSAAAYSTNGLTWSISPGGLPASAGWWRVAGSLVEDCTATAIAWTENGTVVGATITSDGCGFSNPPPVAICGGGGTGATATAVISNGYVVGLDITDAGSGYTNDPVIYIGGTVPSISSEPQPVVVMAHNNATFSVEASANPAPSYQWSFDGTNIAGATSNSLTITNVAQTNLGTYAVTVYNPFGSTPSTGATLSMDPFIVSAFTGATALWGQSSTLSVDAWGSGPLDFQWYDDGVAIAMATNDTLVLTSDQFTNQGFYSVVVSNSFGVASNTPAELVVEPAGVALGMFPGVIITGTVGYDYIIQRNANLTSSNSWVTVANAILTQSPQIWVDTNINTAIPGNPQQFYQVLPGP